MKRGAEIRRPCDSHTELVGSSRSRRPPRKNLLNFPKLKKKTNKRIQRCCFSQDWLQPNQHLPYGELESAPYVCSLLWTYGEVLQRLKDVCDLHSPTASHCVLVFTFIHTQEVSEPYDSLLRVF